MFKKREQYKCDSIDLPVLMIGMHGTVKGATRLQKYAFLSAMQIKNINRINFFNDWQSGEIGAYSPYFASCIGMAVDGGYIRRNQIESGYGFDVDAFTVTEKGSVILHKLKTELPDFYDKILKLTSEYQDFTLGRLLHEAYYKYPKYLLRGDGKGIGMYESDRYVRDNKNIR